MSSKAKFAGVEGMDSGTMLSRFRLLFCDLLTVRFWPSSVPIPAMGTRTHKSAGDAVTV